MLLTTVRKARQHAARRAGFTLLEVLVVVAILVILATVATVATTRYLEDAKKSKAVLQAKSISTAIEAWMMHPSNPTNEPPAQLSDLVAFGQEHGTSFLKNGADDLVDPWSQQFQVKQIQGGDGSTVYLVYTQSKNDGTPVSQFGIGGLSKVNSQ